MKEWKEGEIDKSRKEERKRGRQKGMGRRRKKQGERVKRASFIGGIYIFPLLKTPISRETLTIKKKGFRYYFW